MKNCLIALTTLCAAAGVAHASAEDPDHWHKNQYAPLWNEKPWENLNAITDHYVGIVINSQKGRPPIQTQ